MFRSIYVNLIISAICFNFFVNGEVSERLNNIKIFFDSPTRDKMGYRGPNIKANGELNVIRSLIRPGDLVFDVGANVGKWSDSVTSNVTDVTLYAFEPLPSVFDELSENFKNKNGFAYNLALSNFIGTKEFYYYHNHSTNSGFYDRKILREDYKLSPEEVRVRVDTLDVFCQKNEINKIDFLKIDTEGEELNVLLGAVNLLKARSISIIQFEYGGCYIDSKSTLREVYELLSGFGYSVYRIDYEGLIKISNWRDELENYKYSNYLAVVS